ncbi:hypothetical protein TAFFO16_3 [Bacillus phage Taffo16]|uniref:Uncharacterized protein n=1 Tax=Bacillus phage Taffo16 TaxID=2030094 RepID=A0A249XW64_9CAUD|nr:hypothetical protein TAFFO16_3 [Bacillus phage Taffo16]ULF48624.1 membrane protein [Bacillus phage BillyBob]
MTSIWVGSMFMYIPMLILVDLIMDEIESYKGWDMGVISRIIIAAGISILITAIIDCMALCVHV